MILVDTSVWIDHLRQGDTELARLLEQGMVCMHPLVMGELACGNLRHREQLLALWRNLPQSAEASHKEVLFFLSQHHLAGKGAGFIDMQLLASCQLQPGTRLWTRDKRLEGFAARLNLAFMPR